MNITLTYIEQRFEKFNQQIFDGKLPKPKFELSKSKSFLGNLVFQKRKQQDGSIEHYNFRLRISVRFNLTEDIIDDTIIHEMIHYYIGINKLKDTSAHGKLFRNIMSSINQNYNRHISISHKLTENEKIQTIETKQRWRIVVIVNFLNGKMGIKVLPRDLTKIKNFCKKFISNNLIESYNIYITSEPYFSLFPTSTAPKIFYADKETINKNLKSAKIVIIKGNDVTFIDNNISHTHNSNI